MPEPTSLATEILIPRRQRGHAMHKMMRSVVVMMRSVVVGATAGVLMLSAITAAPAQQPSMMQGQMEDLSSLPSGQQVAALSYCENVFHVRTSEGDSLDFPEFNLRFKVDGSDKGPPAGKPALVSAGMMGDRAFIVFADPAEISSSIAKEC